MTTPTGASNTGQPGTGPDDAERNLLGLQRVLDGLKSSDEGNEAA